MKINLKKYNKQDKGITLIALVITIIVMLILASVTIEFGTGAIEKAKFEGANPLFSTSNGFNVYGFNDSGFIFYLDNYSVVVYSDDNLTTKEFIESLTIEKVKIS